MATFSDNFNRANGALGASWTDTLTGGGLQINGNGVASTASTSRGSRCTTTFTQNHRAQAIFLRDGAGNGTFLSICCRYSGTDGGGNRNCYQGTTNGSDYYITRVVNGSGTDLATGIGGDLFQRNDIVELECNGTTIALYRTRSGTRTLINSVTDSAVSGTGVGLEIYNVDTPPTADDFYAEDISGGSSVAPRAQAHYRRRRGP